MTAWPSGSRYGSRPRPPPAAGIPRQARPAPSARCRPAPLLGRLASRRAALASLITAGEAGAEGLCRGARRQAGQRVLLHPVEALLHPREAADVGSVASGSSLRATAARGRSAPAAPSGRGDLPQPGEGLAAELSRPMTSRSRAADASAHPARSSAARTCSSRRLAVPKNGSPQVQDQPRGAGCPSAARSCSGRAMVRSPRRCRHSGSGSARPGRTAQRNVRQASSTPATQAEQEVEPDGRGRDGNHLQPFGVGRSRRDSRIQWRSRSRPRKTSTAPSTQRGTRPAAPAARKASGRPAPPPQAGPARRAAPPAAAALRPGRDEAEQPTGKARGRTPAAGDASSRSISASRPVAASTPLTFISRPMWLPG